MICQKYFDNKEVKSTAVSQFECSEIYTVGKFDSYRMFPMNSTATYRAASKYDKPLVSFNSDTFATAERYTRSHFMPFTVNSAVMPIEEVWRLMNKQTSSGLFWSLQGFQNKEAWQLQHGFKPIYDALEELTKDDSCYIPLWSITPKKEIRSVSEKILLNKCRVFTASPCEFTAIGNILCLDFNERFYGSAGFSDSFVGASPYYGEWHELLNKIHVFSDHCFDLDGTDYDASVREELFAMIARLRADSYAHNMPNRKLWCDRLYKWYHHVIHSVCVLPNGEMFMKHGGNPSGSNNTVVDNTIALRFVLYYAYIEICREDQRFFSQQHCDEILKVVLYGDDNTGGIRKKDWEWFNPTRIIKVLGKIGMVMSSSSLEPRPLTEVTFLSQNIRYIEPLKMLMPVPSSEKVLASLKWGSDVDDIRWDFLRACALRLVSFWNVECRSILRNFLDWCLEHHSLAFVGELKSVRASDILKLYVPDDVIISIYTGFESNLSCNLELFRHSNLPGDLMAQLVKLLSKFAPVCLQYESGDYYQSSSGGSAVSHLQRECEKLSHYKVSFPRRVFVAGVAIRQQQFVSSSLSTSSWGMSTPAAIKKELRKEKKHIRKMEQKMATSSGLQLKKKKKRKQKQKQNQVHKIPNVPKWSGTGVNSAIKGLNSDSMVVPFNDNLGSFNAPGTVAGLQCLATFAINPGMAYAALPSGVKEQNLLTALPIVSVPNVSGFLVRSNVATQAFDEWSDLDLSVHWIPKCSEYSEDGKTGEVIMIYEPNPQQGLTKTLANVFNYKWRVEGPAYQAKTLRIPKWVFAQERKKRFLRTGAIPIGTSISDYDAGKIYVFITGMSTPAQLLGGIEVKGQFHVHTPCLANERTSEQNPNSRACAVLGVPITGVNSMTMGQGITNQLDMALVQSSDLAFDGVTTLPLRVGATPVNSLKLQPGKYKLIFYANPSFATTGVGTGRLRIRAQLDGGDILLDDEGIDNAGAFAINAQMTANYVAYFEVSSDVGFGTLAILATNASSSLGSYSPNQVNNQYRVNSINLGATVFIEACA